MISNKKAFEWETTVSNECFNTVQFFPEHWTKGLISFWDMFTSLNPTKWSLIHKCYVAYVRTNTDGCERLLIHLHRCSRHTRGEVSRNARVCAKSARFLPVCSIHLSHILYINPPSLVSWKLVHYCILAAELGREIREAADQTHRQTTSDRNTHSLLRASLWSLDSTESQWESRASAFELDRSLSLSFTIPSNSGPTDTGQWQRTRLRWRPSWLF